MNEETKQKWLEMMNNQLSQWNEFLNSSFCDDPFVKQKAYQIYIDICRMVQDVRGIEKYE